MNSKAKSLYQVDIFPLNPIWHFPIKTVQKVCNVTMTAVDLIIMPRHILDPTGPKWFEFKIVTIKINGIVLKPLMIKLIQILPRV